MADEKATMDIWNKMKQPPSWALKTIMGGRLKGKTDVNPQWRYMAMTEQFGVCGIGWRYEVVKLWLEPAGEEICAFAEIALAVKVSGEWSDPIPGIGGSMLLEQETKGLHVSDECYKMAITDALSVAMKMIGVAADVYAGLFDGAKYSERKQSQKPKEKEGEKEDNRSHWCDEHKLAFFKTEKMNSYAHPMGRGAEWCHEHTGEPSSMPPKSTQSVGEDESKGIGNLSDFHKRIHDDFGIQPGRSLKILDKASWDDVSESFEECYSVIKLYHEATKEER